MKTLRLFEVIMLCVAVWCGCQQSPQKAEPTRAFLQAQFDLISMAIPPFASVRSAIFEYNGTNYTYSAPGPERRDTNGSSVLVFPAYKAEIRSEASLKEPPPGWGVACDNAGHFVPTYSGSVWEIFITENTRTNRADAIDVCWQIYNGINESKKREAELNTRFKPCP